MRANRARMKRRLWLLELSEPLASRTGDDSVAICSSSQDSFNYLQRHCGVRSQQGLERILGFLEQEGHPARVSSEDVSKDKLARDLVRSAQAIRWGVHCGFLEPAEGWRRLELVGEKASTAFESWDDYFESYLESFRSCASSPEDLSKLTEAIRSRRKIGLTKWNPLPAPGWTEWLERPLFFWQKNTNSERWKSILFLGVLAATIVFKPVPLGLAVVVPWLATAPFRDRFDGDRTLRFLYWSAMILVGISVIGGFIKEPIEEKGLEMPFLSAVFFSMSLHLCLNYWFISHHGVPSQRQVPALKE